MRCASGRGLLTPCELSFSLPRHFSASDHTRTMSPSDAAWQQLISALHASGRKAALAITGGGSGAVGELLRVPGGSRLLIEAQVPYDELALATFLGFAPAQACSADTAIAMARSARARAARLVPAGTDLVGLGATAALVSDRPRKGEHRFHIAFANSAGIAHCTGVMAKGRRDRAAEEDLVSRAIVLWLARACGVAAPSPRSLLDADEQFAETSRRDRGQHRSAPGGRTRSRHRPARWPNDAVGAAAPRAVAGFLQPDARRACVAGAGRRRAQAAAAGVRNLRHQRRQAAAGGRDGETPARAIRLEVAGRAHASAHLPREVAPVSEDDVRDRGGYGGAAVCGEILRRRRGSNARSRSRKSPIPGRAFWWRCASTPPGACAR